MNLLKLMMKLHYPVFHSLSEILVTYMYEVPELSFKYNLSIDPVEYTKQITKINLNISITKISPTTSRKTSRRCPLSESYSDSSHPMITRSRTNKSTFNK